MHIHAFNLVAQALNLSLRDQEQILIVLRAIILTWNKPTLHFLYLVFCIALRHVNKRAFSKLIESKLTTEDLKEYFLDDIKVGYRDFSESNNGKIPLKTLLLRYNAYAQENLISISGSGLNTLKLPDAIKLKIIEERSLYRPSNQTIIPTSLIDYPQLVVQAGQLTG